jgi:hypothetical protein
VAPGPRIKLDYRGRERALQPMKSVDELVLLLLSEDREPPHLMSMDKQPEFVGNLASGIGQFNEQHAPVGCVRQSPHVSSPFQGVE